MVSRRMRPASLRKVIAVAAAVGTLVGAGTASAAELSVDKAYVNSTGGLTVLGTVDCSADVIAQFGSLDAPAPGTYVYVNVSWTANQPVGRKMLTAQFEDHMASPCWANTSEYVEGCVENTTPAGTTWYGPCGWDTSNYGSSGWIYGNGKFGTKLTHVEALLTNGIWFTEGGGNFDFYQYADADLKPIRVR